MMLMMMRLPKRTAVAPTPPTIASDDYWRSLARWFTPSLDAEDLASRLGIGESTLRHYMSTRHDSFPQPLETGRRNRWSPAQCFDYLLAHPPKQRANRGPVTPVPRLYHHGIGLAPARFVAGEVLTFQKPSGAPRQFAVHTWEPADGRGRVAVAYGVSFTERGKQWAPRLLDALHKTSAVAVITDDKCTLAGELWSQAQIVVAERGLTPQLLGWFDLANLLRVDLPWWPRGLRDVEAMAAWRPGSARQAIRPIADGYDDKVLQRLVDGADDEGARHVQHIVDALNRRFEARIYQSDGPDVPGGAERPGLLQAAFPRFTITNTPPPPEQWDTRRLLDLRVPSTADRIAARVMLSHREELQPNLAHTIRSGVKRGPLAEEWIGNLRQIDDPQSLGSSFAENAMNERQLAQPRTYWIDPDNPDCWVIKTFDGEVHAAIGTWIPTIEGRWLTEFEIDIAGHAAFFRDNTDRVWPMPTRGDVYVNSGYEGHGPQNLFEVVRALRINAGADMRSAAPMTEDTPLSDLISRRKPPMAVSKAEIDELLPR